MTVRFYCETITVSHNFHRLFLLPFLHQHGVMVGKQGRCCLPSFPYLLLTETLGLHSTQKSAGFRTHQGIFISVSQQVSLHHCATPPFCRQLLTQDAWLERTLMLSFYSSLSQFLNRYSNNYTFIQLSMLQLKRSRLAVTEFQGRTCVGGK